MSFEFKYRNYAEALYSALSEDPFYTTLKKSIDDPNLSKEAMLKYMEFSMVEAQNHGILYIPRDHESGVSVWSKPLKSQFANIKHSEKKKFLLNELGSKALNTYQSIVEFMSSKADSFIREDCWYLSIVGVLPRFQGQGLGPGLINDVLSITDTLNVATYLETFTPRNIRFYKRLGYQEIDSFYEPTTKACYWLMIREPQMVL